MPAVLRTRIIREPFFLADYQRTNKLPYTMNSTLDIQWQPRNDLAIDIGYVNALGRHEIIPIPFNQARTATPSNPLCGPAAVCANPPRSPWAQSYTYGYTAQANPCPGGYQQFADNCPLRSAERSADGLHSEGGNMDLRDPYIGIANESESYNAEGISAYNALQAHVEKRLSHGLSAGVSYTFSRSFDEQSAMGLFLQRQQPAERAGRVRTIGLRPHAYIQRRLSLRTPEVFQVLPPGKAKLADGWAVQGVVIVQSGQPYSVIDYSGAVGSIYYGIFNGITNPIVPLNYANGCTPQNARYRGDRRYSRPACP